jgi:EAL and modified HD-GYP domain-containing signal transduction protein
MMGYGSIKRWLSDQLPHASTEPNLQPVRESMVMRARLTALLLDPGVENELRREIYLCGLLSQLDELLGEAPGHHPAPHPAVGTHLRRQRCWHGPYAPSLQMARALEPTTPA